MTTKTPRELIEAALALNPCDGPWVVDTLPVALDRLNWRGIDAPGHGGFAEVVWKMENDERSPRCEANAAYLAAVDPLTIRALLAAHDNEIAALKAAQPVEPATGCACKWNGELSESRCELHEAWHVAILEWSDRAKAAEAKLEQPAPAALKAAQPVQPAFDVDVSVRYILRVVRSKCSLSDIDDCRIRDVIRAELLAAVKATS